MTPFEITAVVTYGIVLILCFLIAAKRSRALKEENDRIYQDEHMNRLESFYKFNAETEEEALINWAEPEGEETEITMKDLNDLDEIDSGHMIF